MIQVKSITKTFKDKAVFSDLSFEIQKGEMVAICGKSGSGKTTLMNCLGQLETIDSGEILYNGQQLTGKRTLRKFFSEEVGFLFQNFALMENETVKKNLSLATKDVTKMTQHLAQFGVAELLNKKVYQLSGGEQQRVALARLTLKDPQLIFADEPTASLDKENAEIVFSALEKLNQQGKTILMVTHDRALASRCTRVLEI